MKLTFLGSGSAFTVGTDNYNSNLLLTAENNKHFLLDCGVDIRFSIHAVNLTSQDIDAVFISHFHSDHCGGLEWLGFTRRFNSNGKKPKLFVKTDMVDRLWNNVLSGGMCSFKNEKTQLDNFFDVQLIGENNTFTWENTVFHTVRTIHVMDNTVVVPSYGLIFTLDNKNIFITFDTQFMLKEYHAYYEKADIIFHDCETQLVPTKVHAHYQQLLTLPDAIRKKTWLYHYDNGKLPAAKAAGFKGFVKKGQCFNFSSKTRNVS